MKNGIEMHKTIISLHKMTLYKDSVGFKPQNPKIIEFPVPDTNVKSYKQKIILSISFKTAFS